MKLPYKPLRLISAIFLPPLIASFIVAILVAPMTGGGSNAGEGALTVLIFAFIIGSALGIVAMLVFGLAVHAIICKLNKRSTGTYAIIGALTGVIVGFVFGAVMAEGEWDKFGMLLFFAACGLASGAISAALFHKIRGPHEPLTSAPNATTSP